MILFAYYTALAFLATLMGVGSVAHLMKQTHFRRIVGTHQLLPARMAWLTASAVTLLEGLISLTALGLLLAQPAPRLALWLHLVCLLTGIAFALYVRQLLQRRVPAVTTCGCTALQSPLTPASLMPATGIGGAALIGLVASWLLHYMLGSPNYLAEQLAATIATSVLVMAIGIGIFFAMLVMLFPALAPAPITEAPTTERRVKHA